MLFLITAAKLIAEVALLALIGQWVLGKLAGEQRQDNLVYQLLQRVGSPFVTLVGLLTPQKVRPEHRPWVAFLLLALAWLALTAAKVAHCVQIGMALCR
jgi:peptidoglycan/LPS O-acetylase OafA/YrhL